ncbi:1-deoxy-D-xylulose 5-phosphate reductoisomerase [Methyloradius palustris]|uniref:1-deoxy-D-xylulose 5-phosphate reductoisomerase n=2 Tax=Methyloradius palustris TaxID=2778876 RepID=A0A8D5G8D9_9PROT|nr:1-deoxy-D-xylulose 5-phosphate reductoisomerase [Methyloradius palustris]
MDAIAMSAPIIQNVTILGATGTIGLHTLDVIARHPDRFRAYALTANTNVDVLFEQCRKFEPVYAVMLDERAADSLKTKLQIAGLVTEVLFGMDALEFVSAHLDVHAVMAAIVGAAGLKPAIAAAESGKRILLANKETLVMSGSLFMQAVEKGGATLLPIDSEHNAIFQVMPQQKFATLKSGGIKKILITASGGPFRKATDDELSAVTVKQALNHPNWVMGPKITVDSATLMNKGLEVIEAHWLFNAAPEQIEVVVHPQSVIHSMVEYVDGSVLAQLGNPDMRTPIAYALGYPERIESGVSSLDLFKIARLDFEEPDTVRFPCLRLAFDALKKGGTAPAILNAANEIAVEAFLNGKIGFMGIPRIIESVLSDATISLASSLSTVIEADKLARKAAKEWMLTYSC